MWDAGGIGTAVMSFATPLSLLPQIAACLGIGAVSGRFIAQRMKITEVPQIVAAFYSRVGLAAVAVSAASYLATTDPAHLDMVHNISSYFGA
jgi:H+-translocating NAD(P) transhydrogenase subunit beta